jgi:dipeptidyl aminopeptidase/acylaminoacyl peptidase
VTFEEYEFCWVSSWTADGREVLFSVYPPFRLLRVSLAGGDPQPILGVGKGARSASLRGDRMVYEQRSLPPRDIWRVPGRGASLPDHSPTKLIFSSEDDFSPAFSPDGRRIAFSSSRGGTSNIWVCDSDGSNPVQLTSFDRHTGNPRWSPDGRRLVFDSQEAGDWNLYVTDAVGGVPRRLTLEPSADQTGAWSPDGSWIYFTSDRSGESQIWKIPPEGGQAVQVTRNGCGVWPEASWDGRFLYCQEGSVLWRVPVGAPERAEAILEHDDLWAWALGRSGFYFALRGADEGYTIGYRDFESGQVTELYRLETGKPWELAVSPDDRWILYSAFGHSVGGSELMLVENFR